MPTETLPADAAVASPAADTTGVAAAGAIAAAWLAVHFGGIFAFHLTSGTWPLAVPLVALQAWLSTGDRKSVV